MRTGCHVAVLNVILLFALLSGSSSADPQRGRDEVFVPSLDAICALGDEITEGCAAIRERQIVDAARVPWRAIGRVNFSDNRVRHHCTGSLVSERLVLTAAHCLFNSRRKAWIQPSSLHFVAGYQRGQAVASAAVIRFVLDPLLPHNVPGSHFGGTIRDWALLELERPIGRQTGYFDLAEPEVSRVDAPEIELAGYAGLRPHVLSVARDCGRLNGDVTSDPMVLTCSAMRGDSGAPLLFERDGTIRIAGILSAVGTVRDEGPFSLVVPAAVIIPAIRDERRE